MIEQSSISDIMYYHKFTRDRFRLTEKIYPKKFEKLVV